MLKKIARWILVLLGICALAVVGLALWVQPVPDHPFFDTRNVQVIAHRGGHGLWPGNTLYAFKHAVEMGVDVLEMDLRSTRDSVLIIFHDDTVDHTTDGTGPVGSFTLAELKGLDAGYHWTPDKGGTYPYRGQGIRVPTLAEVFAALPDVRMNIEMKETDPNLVDAFCRTIREYGKTHQILATSFKAKTLRQFRRQCPEVATSTGFTEGLAFYILSRLYLGAAYPPPAQAVQIPERFGALHVAIPQFIRAAHAHNMHVHIWTVNKPADMQRLLALGVNGIITAYPDRLLKVLGRPAGLQ